MFTGIVESIGKVKRILKDMDNIHIQLSCDFLDELKIDQSLAHNGVCLTVVDLKEGYYTVTAITETLEKTNLGGLQEGDEVNLERCMRLGDRLDGHIVQGHTDQVGTITSIKELDGSWKYSITYDKLVGNITVEKGSITINGTSLTVVDSLDGSFSVCIIPYTYENTTFKSLKIGSAVNLEFDIVGKYIVKLHTKC
jgi:riboflavin synthase